MCWESSQRSKRVRLLPPPLEPPDSVVEGRSRQSPEFHRPRWFSYTEARNTGKLATEINQVGFQMSIAQERRQIVDFEDVLGVGRIFGRRKQDPRQPTSTASANPRHRRCCDECRCPP